MNMQWIRALDASFLVKGLVILGVLVYAVGGYPYYYPFPELTSALTAMVLSAGGIVAYSYSHFLLVNGLPALDVSAECSGVMLLMIFPLVIFLIPQVKLHQRLASLFFIPILFFGNILRIATDAWVGVQFGPEWLRFFHDTFGQIFVFFWTIVLYLVWLHVFDNFPREAKAVHPSGYD